MHARVVMASVLFGSSFISGLSTAQTPANVSQANDSVASASPQELAQPSQETINRIIDRTIIREKEEADTLSQYSPIIETYIQQVRPDKALGFVPKSDFHFLGQADFRSRLKVHSLLESEKKGDWMWSYDPAGFLQMIFVDRGEFDKAHYKFDYKGREFLGEVRCYVFHVEPTPKTHGPRFVGNIWVEDQDMTIVRIQGWYEPGESFSLKTLRDECYLHFDSWRVNVKPDLWLPNYIFVQEVGPPMSFGGPRLKAQTQFWGYQLAPAAREAELTRLLVESPAIKQEAPQRDLSPLEAQREWRREAENNVVELLENRGLLAPKGEFEKVLDTIVKNLEITNNLPGQVDLHCRILLPTNMEMFSVGNTIVLSRGLIDVVPDEPTMAALLAHGMADAMVAKPHQDQYAFSDIMRLTATEVLRHLSFKEEKTEAVANSAKAMEFLKNSPYASELGHAGLFFAQLRAKSKSLRRLISPQLGNQVYFNNQLIQAAPILQPNNQNQVSALPLGSRLTIDPWTGAVRLRKSKPVPLWSPRDKMPLEVTPLPPYLTRYVETSSKIKSSDVFAKLN